MRLEDAATERQSGQQGKTAPDKVPAAVKDVRRNESRDNAGAGRLKSANIGQDQDLTPTLL